MFERNTKLDLLFATLIGIGSLALMFVWSFDGLHPFVWNDTAVAAGVLPKGQLLPGLGNLLGSAIFAVLPFSTAMAVQGLVAKLMVAACGVMAYYSMQWLMGIVSGYGARDWSRRNLAIRIAAAVAAFAFVCSDPMWQAAQGATGATLVVFLVVLTTFLFALLLVTASVKVSVMTLMAAGVLAAESPVGWLILALGIWAAVRFVSNSKAEAWENFLNPERMQRTKWLMTFTFIGAFIVGVLAELYAFASLEGMKAAGVTASELPICYCKAYWTLIVESTDLLGALALLGAVIVPFVIASIMVTVATDEDQFLSFKFSVIYFLTALIAFLQLSPYEFAWFWQAMGEGAVTSKTLLLFSSFLSAITLGWGVYVLCVEVLCRDYRHIEEVLYQNDSEDGLDVRIGHDNVKSVRLSVGRVVMMLLPLLLLAVIVPGRRLPDDRALCALVSEFVRETLDEAIGVKYLFTDGSYDSLIRLEAKRRGQEIVPVSLMADTSRFEAYVRQRGTEGMEDRFTLETGGAEALRTWVTSKAERADDIAAQVGFEMFRLNRQLKPVICGALVRPKESEAKAAESLERCRRLADRIVALHEDGVWRHAKNLSIKDLVLFAQFRLAVLSRLRAINLDAEGKTKESLEEIACSDRLNAHNPSLQRILRKMAWVKRQSGESLTPREGLEVALKRADFVMARRYAMPMLRENPDEPQANFAIGMSYYVEEQFAKAEEFLKRVLKTCANEAAVYNNLALICLKTKRLEEAEKNVKKALELCPDSPEVRDTEKQVKQAFEDRKKPVRH